MNDEFRWFWIPSSWHQHCFCWEMRSSQLSVLWPSQNYQSKCSRVDWLVAWSPDLFFLDVVSSFWVVLMGGHKSFFWNSGKSFTVGNCLEEEVKRLQCSVPLWCETHTISSGCCPLSHLRVGVRGHFLGPWWDPRMTSTSMYAFNAYTLKY